MPTMYKPDFYDEFNMLDTSRVTENVCDFVDVAER